MVTLNPSRHRSDFRRAFLPARRSAVCGYRRDRDFLRHPLGARTVEPAKGPIPVVQQPEHGKACRTAEVIGADRILPATAAPSSIQGEPPNVRMEPTDKDGQLLDGGTTYRLPVPANAPVKQYWSATVSEFSSSVTESLVTRSGVRFETA